MSPSPLPALDALAFSKLCIHETTPTDGTGKRKVDGSYADTRLCKVLTPRWANERFRQVMMLVREFRTEWPNQSLLSNDDVEFIRMAVDTALAMAEREGHVSDIYDLNPTTWSIWLVQHTIATRLGAWTAESPQQRQILSFEGLYRWLEVQHARGEARNLYNPSTKQLLHRYKLPFKAHMVIPPPKNELFKWRKGARRLSTWMVEGGLVPLATGIIEQQPPTLVAAPPLQSRREQARAAMWGRVAARGANLRRMANANEDSEDARLTRGVVRSVMAESRGGVSTRQEAGASPSAPAEDDSEDEMVRELEREMVSVPPERPPEESDSDALARLLEGVRRIEELEGISDCRCEESVAH
jgi:hypothetical protein